MTTLESKSDEIEELRREVARLTSLRDGKEEEVEAWHGGLSKARAESRFGNTQATPSLEEIDTYTQRIQEYTEKIVSLELGLLNESTDRISKSSMRLELLTRALIGATVILIILAGFSVWKAFFP
ncbi:MAG: hypothetical protein HY296_06295 [Thaumarchaeota archaeon]|nr:hypothetical protein [Nitrososphaerota archaeon]